MIIDKCYDGYGILLLGEIMKKFLRNCDKPLLIITLIFSLFGLLMVFSSSSIIASFSEKISPYHYFYRQLMFVGLSYIFGLFIVNYPINKYKKLLKIGYIFTLLSLVLLFFLGKEVNGARSWYDLGIFNYQPSETAKVFIIIYLGFYINNHAKTANKKNNSLLFPLFSTLLFVFLVLLQPDYGTGIIIIALIFMIFLFSPISKKSKFSFFKYIFILIFAAIIYSSFGGSLISQRQIDRFNFKYPCERYYESTGYQLCNSFIAVNNGKLFGVGLGNSTQKYLYLPAAHTDFIFSIIVEEFGSVIGILVILGYIIMIRRIQLIIKNSSNTRNSIIAFGTIFIISAHCLINLSGMLGLIPLTGVPLPFLSYGGSFTLSTYILIFLVQRVAVENKQTLLNKELASLK